MQLPAQPVPTNGEYMYTWEAIKVNKNGASQTRTCWQAHGDAANNWQRASPVLHKDCDVCEPPKNRWTRSGVPCRIINRSKVPLKFEWKDHGTAEEDERSAAGPGAGSRGSEGLLEEGSTPASESDFSQNAGQTGPLSHHVAFKHVQATNNQGCLHCQG